MKQTREIKPIASISTRECQALEYVFTDIDDTITTGGLLPAESYAIIWKLTAQGIKVVPVTGRPAGWCDHIARMWPVTGVIGENGAFYFSYDRLNRKMIRHFMLSAAEREEGQKRLRKIKSRVLSEVHGSGLAADQDYRLADLAIDFCEDVTPLDKQAVRQICKIMEEEGATYKVSSIHVNCWYGDFDKLNCVEQFLDDQSTGLSNLLAKALFIGDSLNDEPMFKAFPLSIGVANLKDFYDELIHFPSYITEDPAAAGFLEAMTEIIKKRESGRAIAS